MPCFEKNIPLHTIKYGLHDLVTYFPRSCIANYCCCVRRTIATCLVHYFVRFHPLSGLFHTHAIETRDTYSYHDCFLSTSSKLNFLDIHVCIRNKHTNLGIGIARVQHRKPSELFMTAHLIIMIILLVIPWT